MQAINILLIEDDELASEIICLFLSDCGFNIEPTFSITDGLAHIKHTSFDLVLLDINLPDFNGFEFLKNIKNRISLPIIVTSAYNDTKSKILAFKYGASDYMVKPIDLDELEARIWVQLGKYSEIKTEKEKKLFEIKDSHILFKDKILNLTTIEFDILSLLIKNRNHITTRDELIKKISTLSSARSLDNHIKNIRKKIGDNGNQAKYIKTEYGVGYKLPLLT
jgi:DNA-binding response OmpR family regulator